MSDQELSSQCDTGNFFCFVIMPCACAILFFLLLSASVVSFYYVCVMILTDLRKCGPKIRQESFHTLECEKPNQITKINGKFEDVLSELNIA
ncbi:uncharacterized protein LOC144633751 isoform X2 [Oculina patagonica]